MCRRRRAHVSHAAASCRRAEDLQSSEEPAHGQHDLSGLEPGSEPGWGPLAGGPDAFPIATDYFRFVVFKDPNWDFKTFDFDKDVALADKIDDGSLNAIDPNLNAFFRRGGKI